MTDIKAVESYINIMSWSEIRKTIQDLRRKMFRMPLSFDERRALVDEVNALSFEAEYRVPSSHTDKHELKQTSSSIKVLRNRRELLDLMQVKNSTAKAKL